MEIKDLQRMIDLNSNSITYFEDAMRFASKYPDTLLVISDCRGKISRLSKLQRILKYEIAGLIEHEREERAYEVAAKRLFDYCEKVRNAGKGDF